MTKTNGLMTKEGFEKLQKNTADIYLSEHRKNTELVTILTAERKSICNDEKNYVSEEEEKNNG